MSKSVLLTYVRGRGKEMF